MEERRQNPPLSESHLTGNWTGNKSPGYQVTGPGGLLVSRRTLAYPDKCTKHPRRLEVVSRTREAKRTGLSVPKKITFTLRAFGLPFPRNHTRCSEYTSQSVYSWNVAAGPMETHTLTRQRLLSNSSSKASSHFPGLHLKISLLIKTPGNSPCQ